MTSAVHQSQPVLHTGAPLEQATAAMILIHGRGASAEGILTLASALDRPDVAYLAPQAAGGTWYPQRFMAPLASNEPWLSSALGRVKELIAHVTSAGISYDKLVLLGFSQGACLALEYAARNARRYGGVVGLSGGLIGPDNTPRDYVGALDGTTVFLGCSDVDAHIPKERVIESAAILEKIGGAVTMRLYPGMEHTVNDDELTFVQTLLDTLDTRSEA